MRAGGNPRKTRKMESQKAKTVEQYQQYVMPTYAPQLLLVKGQGTWVWDETGKKYLDFGAGISVSNLGHCHPAVVDAIRRQSEILIHTSNLFMNEVQPKLAEKLAKCGYDAVSFFANSGAEANEGLIKFARKWGSEQGKYEIIAMEDSFHGRTLATLAATGRSKYRKGFAPDMPGFKHVKFGDFDALKAAITPQTAAILLEPVQGEGGIIPATQEYLEQVRALCDEKGVLLLFDEVQCGTGRIGTFFAFQSYGVVPDGLSMAKAIGNGFPLGVLMVKKQYAQTLTVGTHASTFGGTPLACAAGCAVVDTIINDGLLENCRIQGEYLTSRLQALGKTFPCIQAVRSKGLMVGVVMDRPAGPLLPILNDLGMIALTAGETVLRLLPPLNVTREECDIAVSLIEKALSKWQSDNK